MNKKGFTTVELVLTIILVVIIMATITSVTFTYRDRSNYEVTLTDVIDYKNTLTKIIYDDILNTEDPVLSVTKVSDKIYNLTTSNNVIKKITIIDEEEKIGVNYDEIDYIIPGSSDELVEFEGVYYQEDIVNNLYSLEIMFSHRNLDEIYKIRFVVKSAK